MQHVLELIRQNGDLFYLITFVWTALEGETFVIFAAIAAQKGLLNIWPLFFAAWFGSMFGDQVFFLLGHYYGQKLLKRFPSLEPKIAPVFRALEKYATGFILSYRFMYGVRNVSGIAVGMSSVPWHRFAITNTFAALIWATAFCGGGYLFGGTFAKVLGSGDEVGNQAHIFTMTVLAVFVVLVGVRIYISKRQKAKKNGSV